MIPQWHNLVIEVYRYPQYADDWLTCSIKAATRRKLVKIVTECADNHCVNVLHITNKGKLWIRLEYGI
jgi:hypothetical protein